jgi:uncharacterized delta-60 repeat protein
MDENVQKILSEKDENVVQFNLENNTSSPITITLFDTASLTTIPTSGSTTTSYTASTDLFPSLSPSLFAQNSNNGTFIASDLLSSSLRIVNTTTNTSENNFDNTDGFNNIVQQIALQSDGKILCGGVFTTYKGLTNNYIIRLNSDGTKDLTFDNSIGFDNSVLTIALQSDGKILCGGFFTTYKGVSANGIIRLNSDGTKDLTFDNSIGFAFNIQVSTIAIQSDGKILCGGGFTVYKGLFNNYIIRLNSDGTKDLTFDNSIGFNGSVLTIALQSDGKILCGGGFTQYKGVTNNYIIRLNSDGTKDLTFDNSVGFNGGVQSEIAIQSDGKILVGGGFTTYKGLTNNYIIRLNTDGTKDLTFDNSVGFNSQVDTIAIQSDGKILCGGFLTTYKGVSANRIIRLNSDGSKDLTFDNSIAFNGVVLTIALQSDGKILLGGGFTTYRLYTNNRIIRLNSVGNSASLLNLNGAMKTIIYDSSNNVFYGTTNTSLYVISSDGQFVQNIVALSVVMTSIIYNPNNNYLYCLSTNIVEVYECVTFSLVTTISLGGSNFSQVLSEVTPLNEIYYFDDISNLLQKIDCLTNTIVSINLSLPNVPTSNGLPYYNGYLYVLSNTSNVIDIVDTNTDTYFSSITIPAIYTFNPYISAINPLTNQLFITDSNLSRQFAIIDLPTNSFVSVNTLSGVGGTYGIVYNSITDSMYISGSLFSVVTFTATPFFISGSTNYNSFVNNLNVEPIFVDEIRILTQNLTQLNNQVQFTKIDSNGNQIFFGEFPINKIDIEQNNNIAELKLYGLVFDGRTYINQYVINANQSVSVEIYYKQLDRFSATATYPIFFKPKIQLKDYIKKELNL